ncbi:hypothetical protein Btru_064676 [Bulinus truncatus]|nr:hypothetical protein Btru_064676 [Bulinus truncatus]
MGDIFIQYEITGKSGGKTVTSTCSLKLQYIRAKVSRLKASTRTDVLPASRPTVSSALIYGGKYLNSIKSYEFVSTDVQSLKPIISPHDFFDGGSINVTCDHQTMDIDPSAKYILTLTLSRKSVNDASFNTLAIYSPFQPSGQTVTHFPEGKDWHVTFSGGNNQDSSNVQTIRINVMINNAECADAGLYSCAAFTDLSLLFQSPEQNETADARESQEPLVMIPDNKNGPYYSENVVGENVTLTCVAYGPEDLILTWKYRPLGSQKDRNYPNIVDVTLSQPQKVESSKGPCILWRLETSVSFTLQEYDNGNTYFCVVYDHTDEMSRENFTIGTVPGKPAGSSVANLTSAVTLVVSSLLAVLIMPLAHSWLRSLNV